MEFFDLLGAKKRLAANDAEIEPVKKVTILSDVIINSKFNSLKFPTFYSQSWLFVW